MRMPHAAAAAASVCLPPPPIWSTDAGWLYVKETERTTCTKVGMTFSELDVSLKVSHDECFRVKFEQDYKLMNFLSIKPSFFFLLLPLPSFLITFYSDCRHIVWNLQQKPKKTWNHCVSNASHPPPCVVLLSIEKSSKTDLSSFSIIMNIFYHIFCLLRPPIFDDI